MAKTDGSKGLLHHHGMVAEPEGPKYGGKNNGINLD